MGDEGVHAGARFSAMLAMKKHGAWDYDRKALAQLFGDQVVPAYDGIQGILSVSGTGIGDDEDPRGAEGPGLEAELGGGLFRLAVLEVGLVGHQTVEADQQRAAIEKSIAQNGGPTAIVVGLETASARRGAFHDVGKADAVIEEIRVIRGCALPSEGCGQEAGTIESGPEPVSRVGEVMTFTDGVLGRFSPTKTSDRLRARRSGRVCILSAAAAFAIARILPHRDPFPEGEGIMPIHFSFCWASRRAAFSPTMHARCCSLRGSAAISFNTREGGISG